MIGKVGRNIKRITLTQKLATKNYMKVMSATEKIKASKRF